MLTVPGSGKTLIAALLLRHILEQELEDRAVGKQKKVAFFLVEKVALCFQQYAVLNCNLEHSIAKFYGNMKGNMKTQAFWDSQLNEHMVFVCTAQILLDCLENGFIKMAQINLLIFDEAHHTKKNHPYARIVKNHYIREKEQRPRILGMTASPVDAQTKDVKMAAIELESILCSEIATISDDILLQSMTDKRQVETQETYLQLQPSETSRTELWYQIQEKVGSNMHFRAPLDFTQEASSSLGRWCADRYWQLLITDHEIARLAARTDRDISKDFNQTQAERATEAVRTIRAVVRNNDQGEVILQSPDVSSKVMTLYHILRDAFTQNGTRRAIVFVEKRYTACLLSDLFEQKAMHIPGMTTSYMVSALYT